LLDFPSAMSLMIFPFPDGERLLQRHPGLAPGPEFVHENIGHLGGQQG